MSIYVSNFNFNFGFVGIFGIGGGKGIGSGTIIDKDGTILTCAHAVVDFHGRKIASKGKVCSSFHRSLEFLLLLLSKPIWAVFINSSVIVLVNCTQIIHSKALYSWFSKLGLDTCKLFIGHGLRN